jgi:hypothetical protein
LSHPVRLLCARHERPRRRAAEQSDETASFQLIEFRQVAAIGRFAAYWRAVTKSGLVQCRISTLLLFFYFRSGTAAQQLKEFFERLHANVLILDQE